MNEELLRLSRQVAEANEYRKNCRYADEDAAIGAMIDAAIELSDFYWSECFDGD